VASTTSASLGGLRPDEGQVQVTLKGARDVALVHEPARHEPRPDDIDVDGVGRDPERAAKGVDVGIEGWNPGHVSVHAPVDEIDRADRHAHLAGAPARQSGGERRGGLEGLDDPEVTLSVRVEVHVRGVDLDPGEVDAHRRLGVDEHGAKQRDRPELDAHSGDRHDPCAGGLVQRRVDAGHAGEQPDVPDGVDDELALERGRQQGVDPGHHHALAGGGVHAEHRAADERDHEDDDPPQGAADAAKGRHQYACPMPIAMARGTPRMVGCSPLRGSASYAAASLLKPRTCRGGTR
jgi:hypothetical protein